MLWNVINFFTVPAILVGLTQYYIPQEYKLYAVCGAGGILTWSFYYLGVRIGTKRKINSTLISRLEQINLRVTTLERMFKHAVKKATPTLETKAITAD